MAKGLSNNGIRAELVLELRSQELAARAIAAEQGNSRKRIVSVLDAADRLKICWQDVAGLPEREVYELVFPVRTERRSVYAQLERDMVPKELARVG